MKDVEKIIGQVNGTMAMEGMPLTDEDKDMLRKCITGETSSNDMVKRLIKQYTVVPDR